jgi:hypothetical protein
MDLQEVVCGNGLIWLRMGTRDGLLRAWHLRSCILFPTNGELLKKIKAGNVDSSFAGRCALTWGSDVTALRISPFY